MLIILFVSLLLALLVPAGIVTVFNHASLREESIQRGIAAQKALLAQTADAVDRDLLDIRTNIYQMGSHSDFVLVAFSNAIDDNNRECLMRLTDKISNMAVSHSLAQQVNIYFRKPEKMYYGGVYDLGKFEKDFQINDPGTFFSTQYQNRFLPVRSGEKTGRILMANSIAVEGVSGRVPLAQSFVEIDLDELTHMIRDASAYPESQVLLLDPQGLPLYGSVSGTAADTLGEIQGQMESDSGILTLGGREQLYVTHRSALGLTYISIAPFSDVFSGLNSLNQRLFFMLLFLFALGMLAALVVSRQLYRPINNLVRTLDAHQKAEKAPESEFSYIRDVFCTLFDENEDLKQQLEGNQAVIHERMTYGLLMGLDSVECDEQFDRFWLGGTQFAALCVYMDLLEEARYYVKATLFSAIRGCAIDETLPHIQLTPETFCVICKSEEDIRALLQILEKIHASSPSKLRISVGVGDFVDCREKICQSYRHALEMLDYRKAGNSVSVLRYCETELPCSSIHYPIDKENQIINFILAGSGGEAVALMESIYRENLNSFAPLLLLRVLCTEFILTLQRALGRIGNPSEALYRETMQLLIKKQQDVECDGFLKEIYGVCEKITCYITDNFKEQENLQRIKEFIADNLENDISLEMIASRFDYTPTYFSRYFKKSVGVNFLEYLTRERLQFAKNQLLSTEDEIHTIAQRAGFYSANSFSRTFRQYEGISPSQFRKKVGVNS